MKGGTKYGQAFVALAIGIVLLYSVGTFLQQKQVLLAGASDFSCFYAAGKMVDSGNGSWIYDYTAQQTAQRPFYGVVGTHRLPLPFVFVPYVLVIFAPLALLSYPHALTLWYVINVGLLICVPFLLRRRLSMTGKQLALALLAAGLFLPSSVSLAQGQPTILALVIFTLIFLTLGEGHDLSAGCLLALTIFKPQFALPLLLALMLTKNRRAITGFLVTCLALLGVSVAIAGWRTTLSFPRALAAFSHSSGSMDGEHPLSMPNLRGLFYFLWHSRLSGVHLQALTVTMSVAMVAIVLLAVLANRRGISELHFALITVVTLLASYHSYGHDLVLLLLPLFMVGSYISSHELTHLRMAIGMLAGLLLILPSMLLPPSVMVIAALFFLLALLKESLRPAFPGPVRHLPQVTPTSQFPSSVPVA